MPGQDHVSLLLIYGTVTTGQGNLDAQSLEDAVAQGLVPADAMLWYHVSEFFRIAPGARLVTSCVTLANTTSDELRTLQYRYQGVIKQAGIWMGTQALTSPVSAALQGVCNVLAIANMPLNVLVSPKLLVADYATLVDTATLASENVSFVIAQDNNGYGKLLTGNDQVGIIGAALGALARSQVHTSLAWVEKQNMVTGFYKNIATNVFHPTKELDVLGFLGGSAFNSFTPAQIDAMDSKRYIFLRKHINTAGSYFNHSRTSTALTSDYCYIEMVRTMNKACRNVYNDLLPKLSSPAYIDRTTGFITEDTITSLESVAENGLAQMQRDGELSDYAVQINPNQSVLTTSKLITAVRILPVGVLRELVVKMGFALKLS